MRGAYPRRMDAPSTLSVDSARECNWKSRLVVFFRVRAGAIQYTHAVTEKRAFLEAGDVYVAWPGDHRQELFTLDAASLQVARDGLGAKSCGIVALDRL